MLYNHSNLLFIGSCKLPGKLFKDRPKGYTLG